MNEATAAISWDFGTAYELFASLHVLHESDFFGIRASWTAGVRSRIPAVERRLLEDVSPLMSVPMRWIHSLPAPKDAISALWALKQIPPAERMAKILCLECCQEEEDSEKADKYKAFREILLRVHETGARKTEDVDYFVKMWSKESRPVKRETVERALDWWARPAELGEGFLAALQSYYQSFFEEEEKRLEPVLKAGLERAQSLAATLSIEELFVELSQGVQLGEEFRAAHYVIAPLFWTTPLIMFERLDKDTLLLLFGARPAEMSAIPGESLPDGLVRALKALADPTRLKILFYLSHENLAPSELARRLHLRAPTVTHHLSELRLASLVDLSVGRDEKRYHIRAQALESTFGILNSFLQGKMEETNDKQ